MKNAYIIFPHQLFERYPVVEIEGDYFLVEEYLFFKQYNFHKQKIVFHRASMKFYESYLRQQDLAVEYIESIQELSDVRKLIPYLTQQGYNHIHIIDPVDDWLSRRIQKACTTHQIALHITESPLFMNTTEELADFFNPTKNKFYQTSFYKQERIKRKILIDEQQQPIGGQWTFDSENRKKYPKGKSMVKATFPTLNAYYEEAIQYCDKYFSDHLGSIDQLLPYPIDYQSSATWLQQFLMERFESFGEYEDAIVYREMLLHHSLLTPMLNVGLLLPTQIVDQALKVAEKQSIPINSLEGFIRQVIGWREFIRGVYIAKGRAERTRNYWGFSRKIPKSFYDGTTGIFPIDETIKKLLKTGYCHHIERLMVLGNFMLLCEFDPDEVYRWFMEMFIDAYDWVMVPNVYGMSQFADGGMMSTKPYISGSNYLFKMSDYPKGAWQEVWDALFWSFLVKQRAFFQGNPRLAMLLKTYDKWEESKKELIQNRANEYLKSLDNYL